MKAAIHLSVLVAVSAALRTMNRTTRELRAESICGELGVMSFNASDLPDHVSPDNIRMCAKHPHGRNRTLDPLKGASLPPAYANHLGPASNASMSLVRHLGERSCYFAAPYGCSRGGCWKVCDEKTGKWCWAAENGGYGHWRYCKTYVKLMSTAERIKPTMAVVICVGHNVDAAARRQ